MKMKYAVVALTLSVTVASPAGIIFTPLDSDQYRVQMSATPFMVTASGVADILVVEDFFASNAILAGLYVSGGLIWQRNDDPEQLFNMNDFLGTFHLTINECDPNDLLMNWQEETGYNVVLGDTVTITADFVFRSQAIPALSDAESFTVKLCDNGTMIGSATVVPEPSTLAFMGVFGCGLYFVKRQTRRRNQSKEQGMPQSRLKRWSAHTRKIVDYSEPHLW